MADEVVLPKGKKEFKLSEVCKLADVQPYMLRFWSTEFPQLEASKDGTGQRRYTRKQVATILEIRRLLFDEGLTIAGARKRIQSQGVAPAATTKSGKRSKKNAATQPAEPPEVDKPGPDRVKPLLTALRDIRNEVSQLVAELRNE
jgi:DNA-binding transcriptional MerR regulator